MNYAKIYDSLYSLGYHMNGKNHGQRFVEYLTEKYQFDSILDIGCSTGMTVKKFRIAGKNSYGIDASQVAISWASDNFKVRNVLFGLANDIPFKDNYFDAVFSCDVLEHLNKEDAKNAIAELKRVAKKYIFVYIDGELERNRNWLKMAKAKFPKFFSTIDNLHLTLMPVSEWQKMFEDLGCKLIENFYGLLIFENV